MSKVEEFLKLQSAWSEALAKGNDKKFRQLTAKGDKLKEKFKIEDWEELIKHTDNIHAKIHYSQQIKKLKGEEKSAFDEKYTYYEIYGLCRSYKGKTERYKGNGKWKEVDFDAKKYVEEHFMDSNLSENLTEEQYYFLIDEIDKTPNKSNI